MIEPIVTGCQPIGCDAVSLTLHVPPDHPAFDGHCPGYPMLPGVVQLDWALRLAAEHLGTGAPVSRDVQVKFRRVIAPMAAVTLELRFDRTRSLLDFTYRFDGDVASAGRARLDQPG